MRSQSVLSAFVLATITVAAQAHHSYAMFDFNRRASVQGVVKTVEWTNPHVWIWVVSDQGDSEGAVYGFEALSPGELVRFNRWTKHSLQAGDRVVVEFVPLRSGRNGGALAKVTLPDGRVLETRLSRVAGSGAPRKSPEKPQ